MIKVIYNAHLQISIKFNGYYYIFYKAFNRMF